MIKQLLEIWELYKQTERYKNVLGSTMANNMGMGFMNPTADIFTDFMDWLSELQKEEQ